MDNRTASYEPIVIESALFYLDRRMDEYGTVQVHVGDRVEPDTEIVSAMVLAGRPVVVQVARELDISPDSVARYLTKPIGSAFEQGEVVAKVRRGLRSITCQSPVVATLTSLDAGTGAATLTPKSEPKRLLAGVYGEVESIIEGRGAMVHASGSRIRGIAALGGETFGPLKVAVDRPGRELTADSIDGEFTGAMVLGGMTVGAAAVRRLIEVGARGVIVGSISEAEIRRSLARGGQEPTPASVWRQRPRDLDLGEHEKRTPFTVFVTEGFGRRRMAAPIYRFLSDREHQVASVLVPPDGDLFSARPDLFLTSDRAGGSDAIQRVSPRRGSVARLIDPEHLGVIVTCRGDVLTDLSRDGIGREVVDVEFTNGARRRVPAVNLEIVTP
jgi:hypothetical protein